MINILTKLRQVQRVTSSKATKKMINSLTLKMKLICKTVNRSISSLVKSKIINKSSLIKRKVKVPCKILFRLASKLVLWKIKKTYQILRRKMDILKQNMILIGCLNTFVRSIWCQMTTGEPSWILLNHSSIPNELTNYRL